MKKLKQFDFLVLHEFEEEEFHLPTHGHTYYELVYIYSGDGIHWINNNRLPYRSGDLFVLSPDDEHYFEIRCSTHFAFIKFTDAYFQSRNHLIPHELLQTRPENIMRHKLLKEVKLVMDEPCVTILRNTVKNIMAYNCRSDISSSPIVYYQILSIFGLIKEAMAKLDLRIDQGLADKEALISYINQYIYDPEKILVRSVAKHFNISPTYFSAYFKRNFSISYREYINNYRIQLIEKRLLGGNMTMREMAEELGFTDESHLSHYFKSKKRMSPREFIRQRREIA